MANLVPVVQIPTGQPAALADAVAMLLCVVLDGTHSFCGLISATVDEETAVARIWAATRRLVEGDAGQFEQDRWLAAGRAAP